MIFVFQSFLKRTLLEVGPSERGTLITEKVKLIFYYEVILDIWGYFHFYMV